MQRFKVKGMHIDGVSACLPAHAVDNVTALKALYGDEAETIVQSTGIATRTVADDETTSTDLCVAAAEHLLQGCGTAAEEIGGIVFVTFTPDYRMPFNASAVQDALHLPTEIPAFDLSLACSGYAYGLYIASTLAAASGKKILLLDGDVQTHYVDKEDKATVPVMADAGSATLLSPDGSDTEWTFTFYTDGSGRDILSLPQDGTIFMDGFGVYKFVAQKVSKWLAAFMAEEQIAPETLDAFVPHQANMFMIRQLAKKLKIPWDRTWQSGDAVGNSGSATVPVTIAKNAEALLKKDTASRVLVSGFGAGMSGSAGYITLDDHAYYAFFRDQGKEKKG